jgi:hypothetical protein
MPNTGKGEEAGMQRKYYLTILQMIGYQKTKLSERRLQLLREMLDILPIFRESEAEVESDFAFLRSVDQLA